MTIERIPYRTEGDGFILNVVLDATPKRVWDHWADEALRRQWWGDHVTLDLRTGGHLSEHWSDGAGHTVQTKGAVLVCRPPEHFQMTWADADWSGETRLLVKIEAERPGSRLIVEHRGWSDLGLSKGRQAELIKRHGDGWGLYLAHLQALLKD